MGYRYGYGRRPRLWPRMSRRSGTYMSRRGYFKYRPRRGKYTRQGAFGTKYGQKVMNIKRTFTAQLNTTAGISGTSFPVLNSTSINLNQFPDYTEWTTLFDQYKLNAMKVTFYQPYSDTNASTTAAEQQKVILYTCIDKDSPNPPASLNAMREYPSYKRVVLTHDGLKGGKASRYLRSNTVGAAATSVGGNAGGYVQAGPRWFNMVYSGIPHFGLQWAVDVEGPTGPVGLSGSYFDFSIHIEVTGYFQLKGIH